jgi:hypothetical protein
MGSEHPLDVVDRVVLFAQGNNQRAGGIGFGLGLRTGPALTKEVKGLVAKLGAEDAESPWGVAEAPCHLLRGELFDEIGSKRFILALGSRSGCQEEVSLFC